MGPLSVCLSATLVYSCQTVGRIKMPLGKEVLSHGPVGHWDQLPHGRGRSNPLNFHGLRTKPASVKHGLCLLWRNCCMDQDAAWFRGRRRPRRHYVRWGPSCPRKGAQQPPLFGP